MTARKRYPHRPGRKPTQTLTPPPNWTERADCANPNHDPDVWFPTYREDATHAAAICATCPVHTERADYATTTRQQYGVWAGKLLDPPTATKTTPHHQPTDAPTRPMKAPQRP